MTADANSGLAWVFEGKGGGQLAVPFSVATGLPTSAPFYVALGKLSRVGQSLPDLVVAAQSGKVEVLTNDTSGSQISFDADRGIRQYNPIGCYFRCGIGL